MIIDRVQSFSTPKHSDGMSRITCSVKSRRRLWPVELSFGFHLRQLSGRCDANVGNLLDLSVHDRAPHHEVEALRLAI